MININDEMLNQFLDNQLSGDEKEIVKNAIANSSELKRKYDTLISTDKLLRNVENDSTSLDFTKKVLQRINNQKNRAKQQKYFLFTILSVLGIITLSIVGFIFVQIIPSSGTESNHIVTEYSQNIGDYFSNIFGKKNI
jgi:anti-sigma factor RsiW